MRSIETNIYEIENLADLNCNYRLYRIKGISRDSEDYEKNVRLLVDSLSRRYNAQSPCEAFTRNDETVIAQPEGYSELPETFQLVRANIKIEKLPGIEEIDFRNLTQETSKLAIRFLQFSLQNPLFKNRNLWQPKAGYPFFNKSPDRKFREIADGIDLYRGFSFRMVCLSQGRLGISVDTTGKYISRNYLPTKISRDQFKRNYKNHHCLYEYGDRWYEIKLNGLSDLNVQEVVLPSGKTLFEEINDISGKNKSIAIHSLPKDCSVLFYRNSRNEERNIPAGLCRLTYNTQHNNLSQFHNWTIKPPHIRRGEIQLIMERNFSDLMFGNAKIQFSEKPIRENQNKIFVPDLEFGNQQVLSLRQTPASIQTGMEEFGRKKMEVLYSNGGGIYVKKPFDRQYLIIPKSVYETYGKKFVWDLKSEIKRLFKNNPEIVYSPTVIPYDDSVQKSVYSVSKKIIETVDAFNVRPGFGVVMIPKLASPNIKKEDVLGNSVMRELRKREVFVSIIHTTVSSDSYERKKTNSNNDNWDLVSDVKQRGKFKGYLRNIALNKILLLNSYWPFVLKTPLNADLTIGIDVKGNTAGFTLVYKNGSQIRFVQHDSNQREQLSKAQMKTKIIEILKSEDHLASLNICDIVIHRDGILYSSEKEGIKSAIKILKSEEFLKPDVRLSFVEIKKSSRLPLRLFSVIEPKGLQEKKISNPSVGTFFRITDNDYFICTTGYPFRHKGTSKPLHIIKCEGNMSTKKIVEDIFYLSNLTWTKIDDCSRVPLTIKMADIRLREVAGEYDKDALFGEDDE